MSVNTEIIGACARGKVVGIEDCFERYVKIVVEKGKYETLERMIDVAPKTIGRYEPFWDVMRSYTENEKILQLLRKYAHGKYLCLELLEYSDDPVGCIGSKVESIRKVGGKIEGRWLEKLYRLRQADAIPVLKEIEELQIKVVVERDGKRADEDATIFVKALTGR